MKLVPFERTLEFESSMKLEILEDIEDFNRKTHDLRIMLLAVLQAPWEQVGPPEHIIHARKSRGPRYELVAVTSGQLPLLRHRTTRKYPERTS